MTNWVLYSLLCAVLCLQLERKGESPVRMVWFEIDVIKMRSIEITSNTERRKGRMLRERAEEWNWEKFEERITEWLVHVRST